MITIVFSESFPTINVNQKVTLLAGYVARTYNPASGRLGVVAVLRLGVLLDRRLR